MTGRDTPGAARAEALFVRVKGTVQGVGFRPFVYRLACAHGLHGWVLNGADGVEVHVEGPGEGLRAFVAALHTSAPPAADVAQLVAAPAVVRGYTDFTIRASAHRPAPTARVTPDLPVCADCLAELFDPSDPRYHYPYLNCTRCGPRYSIVLGLPYDRVRTTMRAWTLCPACRKAYEDPADRRYHAQPTACPTCGPAYLLREGEDVGARGEAALRRAVDLLRAGRIVAVKGLGGYHLACDARNREALIALRTRKYRKEKPFAVMVRDAAGARRLVEMTAADEALLTSMPRPIVLLPRRTDTHAAPLPPEVAPDRHELGLLLPYTPLHHLLFDLGAPDVLVMTSANRSSEPIAHDDDDALARLGGLADAFLIGERPIARRVDDSVARVGPFGPVVLRRARGYAPSAVAALPAERPILALGADLKNSVTLVVDGQAFVSQHVGDLAEQAAREAFRETVRDLLALYGVRAEACLVVHDAHPEYVSTRHAHALPAARLAVQHHRAHVASVLAERGAWERLVVGVAFDGTGYGDDGTVWGGEVFVGSVATGFTRAARLWPALLPGGDAAARAPVQAAAGFLAAVDDLPDLTAAPFGFPEAYRAASRLAARGVRTFPTTSGGRLFDAAAALLGFTRPVTFEGQAAAWLEQLARCSPDVAPYPFPGLDYRPLLAAVVADRLRGRRPAEVARAFHRGVAQGVADVCRALCRTHGIDTLVLSGGVFQNMLLLHDLRTLLAEAHVEVWTNHLVPPNDGGISLGQAAIAAVSRPSAA